MSDEKEGRSPRKADKPPAFLSSPRCGAKTRKGPPCKSPAMANGRCRMHGGKSTGPKTAEGRAKCAQARWKHGKYCKEAADLRRRVSALLREARALVERVEEEMSTSQVGEANSEPG